MTERNPVLVVVLSLVTCGLYGFYHAYITTQELCSFTGRTDINPTTELLLNIVTCGIFGMYIEYRNQQIIDELYKARGVAHEERAMIVGVLNVATFVVGATYLVATFLYQDELNKVMTMGAGAQPAAGFGPPPATY
ncbi:MAG: DUF4234 domain-containing protein [Sandaracinaceae bacterium]